MAKAPRARRKRGKLRAALLADIARKSIRGEKLTRRESAFLSRDGHPVEMMALLDERNGKTKTGPKPPRRHSFYRTKAWFAMRYKILERDGAKCACCGRSAADGVTMNVDHIEPLSMAWHRRLDPTNLQVLCCMCNQGKGREFDTDWRRNGDAWL